MMRERIALCVEGEAIRNPEIIGLGGEVLDAQPWLDVYTTGLEARNSVVGNDAVSELWVLSCDDVEPINLAASVKSDSPELGVRLVTSEACGSLLSRAHTAQIDEVIDDASFPRRYVEAKRRFGSVAAAEADVVPEAMREAGAAAEREVNIVRAQASAAVVLDPLALIEEPQAAPSMAHFLQLQPQPGPLATASGSRGFVLTVVSGSGGAGKSAIAAIGAVIAQKTGHRTLLLDCDLQFGDVAEMVGVENPLCIDEVLARLERLDAEFGNGEKLAVLAAPSRLETSEEVVRQLPGLLDRLAGMFEVVVVNTGASWAEQHATLLERSSAALFLIDQRVSSVNACRHALELCARCGIAANPFQFALNRCGKGALLTSIDVSCALQGVPVFELKDGGREVEDYLSAGGAAELVEMRNELAKSLEHIMAKLLPGGDMQTTEQVPAVEERRLPLRRTKRRGRK